jgi:hypothetical protein
MSLPLPEAVELAVGFVRLDAGVERDRPFANVALEAQLRALHLLRLRKVRGFKIDAGELLATTATGSSLVGALLEGCPQDTFNRTFGSFATRADTPAFVTGKSQQLSGFPRIE